MSSDSNPAKRFCGASPTKGVTAEKTIQLEIKSLSDFKKKTTPFHDIAGLPWRLTAAITEKSLSTEKFFSVNIHCNPDSESSLWSCEAIVEFRLNNQHNPSTPLTQKTPERKFNHITNWVGFGDFIKWTDIMNPEKGYIKNGSVSLEAQISVKETKGVRLIPSFDFTDSHPTCSDGILLVDNVRLHISKPYLALYSPVFAAMFFGEFSERDLEEIPLQDIDADEFVEMLHVIYPSHKAVSGDRYEVQYVMSECEKFLIKTDKIPLIKKLVWADQYGLTELQDVCVRTFRSTTDIKNQIKSTKEYGNLGEATKEVLLQKMFKLT